MEERPEFVSAVGTDHIDAERELLDHVVHEVERVFLGVPGVDLECPQARRIVDRGVLEASHRLPTLGHEGQNRPASGERAPLSPELGTCLARHRTGSGGLRSTDRSDGLFLLCSACSGTRNFRRISRSSLDIDHLLSVQGYYSYPRLSEVVCNSYTCSGSETVGPNRSMK